MKSFRSHISESIKSPPSPEDREAVCGFLSHYFNPHLNLDSRHFFEGSEPFHRFMRVLWSWSEVGEGSTKRSEFDRFITDMVFSCKSRADWSKHRTGKIFRGLWRKPSQLKEMGFRFSPTKPPTMDGIDGLGWIFGKAVYRPKNTVTSWSRLADTAKYFSGGGHIPRPNTGTVRIVMWCSPDKDVTLDLDAVSMKFPNSGEREILVGSSTKGMDVGVAVNIVDVLMVAYASQASKKHNTIHIGAVPKDLLGANTHDILRLQSVKVIASVLKIEIVEGVP